MTNTAQHSTSMPGDFIDQLSDGYFELDRDFRYRRVNPAALRLVHLAERDLLGRQVTEVFPEVSATEVHAAVMRVMAGGEPEHVETYYAPLHLWGINSIYPLPDGVAIVSHDITEQKRLERNLSFLAEASKVLASSLDYQRTLRAVAKLAVPHIADWCAVDILTGPRSVELLAVAHVDPKKVRWAKELRKREPVKLDAPSGLPNALRTGKSEFYPEITEAMIVAAARDERQLELIRSIGFSSVIIAPLLVRRKAIGALTLVTAESGRHFTAADLSTAEELAARAALAIENARLFTASQRAVELRDDFIAAASHELKTPVTSLKVYTQVLERQALRRGETQTTAQLGKMNAQIDRLTLLIGDLLDISKIEGGKLTLEARPVDLNAVVGEAVEGVQLTTPVHRIAVEGSTTRFVIGDRERLGQVVTNLLTNAIKYSPKADRVLIRLWEDERAAHVEVEDFGIGIDHEHVDQIFERFYRVSSPDEKTFPGLGIGLYISHEIVRRHGGTMSVKSVKGRGSTFGFALPFGERKGLPSTTGAIGD